MAQSPKRSVRLGEMAERQVALWSAEQGIAVTKTDVDRCGWDLMLELPSNPPTNVLVQVKATDHSSKRCSVAFDNWERMVRQAMPCFFLVLEYEGSEEPTNLYTVHVWDDWIVRVLKRIHEFESGVRARGKRPVLYLTWDDRHKLSRPCSEIMLRALGKDVGKDPFNYVKSKQNLIERAGSESRTHHVEVSFTGKSDAELCRRMAEHAIGITPTLDVSRMKITEERYGILVPVPIRTNSNSSMTAHATPIEGQIRVKNRDGSRVFHDRCQVYPALAVFPFLPAPYHLLRIVAGDLSLVLDPGCQQMQVSFSLPKEDVSTTTSRARRAATLYRIINEHKIRGIEIEVITSSGTMLLKPSESLDLRIVEDALPEVEVIDEFCSLANYFGLPDDDEVRLPELFRAADHIHRLLKLIEGPEDPVGFTGTLVGSLSGGPHQAAVVFALGLSFEDRIFAGVFSIEGTAIVEPETVDDVCKFSITNGLLSTHDRIVFSRPSDPRKRLERRLREVADDLEQSGIDVVIKMPVH